MNSLGTLNITTPSDREIEWIRNFNAPRNLVFEAMTKPELIKRWLLGPEGWTMPLCEVDLRVGGSYRYVWEHPVKGKMGMGGIFREIARPERIVSTEKFDDPWYSGEAIGTVVLIERGGKTTLTATTLYDSKETRDGVLKSNMEKGVIASYDRLAEVLASIA